jgi:hypothetical protein
VVVRGCSRLFRCLDGGWLWLPPVVLVVGLGVGSLRVWRVGFR